MADEKESTTTMSAAIERSVLSVDELSDARFDAAGSLKGANVDSRRRAEPQHQQSHTAPHHRVASEPGLGPEHLTEEEIASPSPSPPPPPQQQPTALASFTEQVHQLQKIIVNLVSQLESVKQTADALAVSAAASASASDPILDVHSPGDYTPLTLLDKAVKLRQAVIRWVPLGGDPDESRATLLIANGKIYLGQGGSRQQARHAAAALFLLDPAVRLNLKRHHPDCDQSDHQKPAKKTCTQGPEVYQQNFGGDNTQYPGGGCYQSVWDSSMQNSGASNQLQGCSTQHSSWAGNQQSGGGGAQEMIGTRGFARQTYGDGGLRCVIDVKDYRYRSTCVSHGKSCQSSRNKRTNPLLSTRL